jgi:hypothetical protein
LGCRTRLHCTTRTADPAQPFRSSDLIVGVVAIPGVALVVGGTPAGMRSGIAVGIVPALLVWCSALNKRYVGPAEPLAVMGVELAAGTVFLTLAAVVAHG